MRDKLKCTLYLAKYAFWMNAAKIVAIATKKEPYGEMIRAYDAFEKMFRIFKKHEKGDMLKDLADEWGNWMIKNNAV